METRSLKELLKFLLKELEFGNFYSISRIISTSKLPRQEFETLLTWYNEKERKLSIFSQPDSIIEFIKQEIEKL